MMDFSSEALTANIVLAYVKPTEEERTLREELKKHEYVELNYPGSHIPGMGFWFKILFVCEESVIVQEVLLTAGETRFQTEKILLPVKDWAARFVCWIDKNHDRWDDVPQCFDEGFEMYNAD